MRTPDTEVAPMALDNPEVQGGAFGFIYFVTIEFLDGAPKLIDLTDGQRITLIAPAEAA